MQLDPNKCITIRQACLWRPRTRTCDQKDFNAQTSKHQPPKLKVSDPFVENSKALSSMDPDSQGLPQSVGEVQGIRAIDGYFSPYTHFSYDVKHTTSAR